MRIQNPNFWLELPSSVAQIRFLPKNFHEGYILIMQSLVCIFHNGDRLSLEGEVRFFFNRIQNDRVKKSGANSQSCDT